MGKSNLIVADKEYLIAERLSESYMNKIVNAATEYIKIIVKLIDDGGIEDDKIKSALIELGSPLVRLIYEYGGEMDFIDKKIQNYIDKIDDIDDFIY